MDLPKSWKISAVIGSSLAAATLEPLQQALIHHHHCPGHARDIEFALPNDAGGVHAGQLTLAEDVAAHRVVGDERIVDVGHVAKIDVELGHDELDAERHAIEHVGDGNRHLAPGLDEVEPRDMIPRVLEKEAVGSLDIERAAEMILA